MSDCCCCVEENLKLKSRMNVVTLFAHLTCCEVTVEWLCAVQWLGLVGCRPSHQTKRRAAGWLLSQWAGSPHLHFTGKITRSGGEVSAHGDTLWWRNLHILLFIVSSTFDLQQPPVPAWRQQAAISNTSAAITQWMDPHIPQRHWRLGGRTVHSFFYYSFHFFISLPPPLARSPQQRHGNTGDEYRQRKSWRKENGGGGGGGGGWTCREGQGQI